MMKRAFCALVLFCGCPSYAEPPPQPMQWRPVSELYVAAGPARLYSDNVVYVQTHMSGPCAGQCTEGVFHRVDLAPYGVPVDAKAAFLSGMLIITHGETVETADLQIVFRAPGDTTSCARVMGQTTEAHVGGGQRSMMATWVPLYGGAFEWCFRTSTPGSWPTHSSYGVNLSLQAWVR